VIWILGYWFVALSFMLAVFSIWCFQMVMSSLETYRQFRDLIICPGCRFLLSSLATQEMTGEEGSPDLFWCSKCDLWYGVEVKPVEFNAASKKKDEAEEEAPPAESTQSQTREKQQ